MLIDEAWHLVRRRETGDYANDLALRARHLGLVLAVMFQQLSQADTEHGLALLQNSTMQLLLAQHPSELAFMQSALKLSDEERELVARLKTVKGSHAQMLWINGTRGRGRVSARVGPLEYWAFTSDQGRDTPRRDAALREHDGDAWAAITRARPHHRDPTGAVTATAHATVRARPHQRARHRRDLRAPRRDAAPAAPLLAVCGVCGGAGASTISALIASAAAAHGHVLVADTGGPSGGLSARTGVQTPWSLPEAAELLVRDPDLARQLWATRARSGRSSAASSPPRPAQLRPPSRRGSTRLLEILRCDLHHALVVIDCGTLQHEHGLHTLRERLARRLGAPRHRPRRRPRPSAARAARASPRGARADPRPPRPRRGARVAARARARSPPRAAPRSCTCPSCPTTPAARSPRPRSACRRSSACCDDERRRPPQPPSGGRSPR